uniref:C2H2-type domain-containing protein n=1 Tax=Chelonoidis abingdonii TaxID=106734 RepID=A0A8C0INZ6_CHEAB
NVKLYKVKRGRNKDEHPQQKKPVGAESHDASRRCERADAGKSRGRRGQQRAYPAGRKDCESAVCEGSSKKLNRTIAYQGTKVGAQLNTQSKSKRSFSSSSALDLHQKTHSDEKRYGCAECGKSYRQNSHLRSKHLRTHKEEKPYSCTDCGKSFRESSYLALHKRIHTGEKPYQCPDCDKSFRLKGDLSSHCRTHTGEKPHKCTECGQGFRQRSTLTKHLRTHTGERPYKLAVLAKNKLTFIKYMVSRRFPGEANRGDRLPELQTPCASLNPAESVQNNSNPTTNVVNLD